LRPFRWHTVPEALSASRNSIAGIENRKGFKHLGDHLARGDFATALPDDGGDPAALDAVANVPEQLGTAIPRRHALKASDDPL